MTIVAPYLLGFLIVGVKGCSACLALIPLSSERNVPADILMLRQGRNLGPELPRCPVQGRPPVAVVLRADLLAAGVEELENDGTAVVLVIGVLLPESARRPGAGGVTWTAYLTRSIFRFTPAVAVAGARFELAILSSQFLEFASVDSYDKLRILLYNAPAKSEALSSNNS